MADYQLYELVKKIASKHGLNAGDVAKKADMSLQGMRRGLEEQKISLKYLLKICEILDISIASLFEGSQLKVVSSNNKSVEKENELLNRLVEAKEETITELRRQLEKCEGG